MKQRLLIIFLLVGFLISALIFAAPNKNSDSSDASAGPDPLWNSNGLQINNTPGNTPQQNPLILSSGAGSYYVVWEDGRNGNSNLFAQKVDGSGKALWAAEGVVLAKVAGNQNFAQVVADGTGGIIVAWQDYRSGNADIYAQHLDSDGGILWQSGGAPVCTASAGQFAPQLVGDGVGGAIITWHDYRSGSGEDIYAQKIDSAGNAAWKTDGIVVCDAAGTQWYPAIASDGKGGAVIVWTDGRIGSTDNNIYGQRISASGELLWQKDGLPICTAQQNQEHVAVSACSGGVIVAWNDWRSGNCDVYAQKIDLDGKALWQKDGVSVVTAPFSQQDPVVAGDVGGGGVIAWTDSRGEENAIYIQKLSKDGAGLWGENGRQVGKSDKKQQNPVLLNAGNGWLVLWEDFRKGPSQVYAQKINNDGVNLWADEGVLLAGGAGNQEKISACLSSAGDVVSVWQDKRNGNYDIFGQMVNAQSNPVWGDFGNSICEVPGSVIHQNINAIASGSDVILVFEDARSGFYNIYAQKVSAQGVLMWGKDGLPLAKERSDQLNPHLVSDGAGGAIVAWEDRRDPDNPIINAQKISSAGRKVWGSGSLPLNNVKSKQANPQVIPDGSGGALIFWEDERNPLSYKDIYGQKISAQGELLWGDGGTQYSGENGDQTDLVAISDGSGGAFLAWTDFRNGERNPDIYGQLVDKAGQSQWQKDGLQICGAPDIQRGPQLIKKNGGVLVVWTDKGGGSYDIYGQLISRAGQTLWTRDGIPINQMPRTQQGVMLANSNILVWEDYRYGNWDIFANAVSDQGKLQWGEEGKVIVSLPLTQYAPQAAGLQGGGAVVAWEDYRSGKQYEIYLQRLGSDGSIGWKENGVLIKSSDGARAPKLVYLDQDSSVVVLWEDYTGGGRAIFGQKFSIE